MPHAVRGGCAPGLCPLAMELSKGRTVAREFSWKEAIQTVLRDAGGLMHYTDIAAQISARGLRKSANPAANVSAILGLSLKDEDTPFVRLERGIYTLRDNINKAPKTYEEAVDTDEEDAEAGALRAFGMFWYREQVAWGGRPRLLGRQGLGADDVNFSDQVGVYILYDRERVIYVGRANDTLFSRLKFHTTDRLAGRWDRFSWFGLRSVRPEGWLAEPSVAWTHEVVIETLEALLIESLEPPLNRRRGDNFSGAEYIQVSDPDIERKKRKRLLEDLQSKLDAVES